MPPHLIARLTFPLTWILQRLQRATAARLSGLPDPWRRRARPALLAGLFLLFGGVAAFGVVPHDEDEAMVTVLQVEEELALPSVADQLNSPQQALEEYTHAERIRRGDTLAALLTRMQVNDPKAESFVARTKAARPFYQLRPGRLILARTARDGSLIWLRYRQAPSDARNDAEPSAQSRSLVLERDGTNFQVREATDPMERHVEMRSASIQNSLFSATDAAGIPDGIANQITEIFAGDIDFYRDVRRGDELRVVYEMVDEGGERSYPGRILAVEYVSGARAHDAVWYQPPGEPGGYYGLAGQSLRRPFLRAPLQFTRISSGFGGRMHPILAKWRWHTGIDYAAPIGTPVRATGDGTIVSVGWENGYGNSILIRHEGAYSTLYGHLSGFAAGLRRGQSIAQGEVIGYVGMTGWATGPHLHYEFRVAGTARDPLHTAMPQAAPLDRAQLGAFLAQSAELERQMGLLREIDLARASPTPDGNGG